MTERMKDPEAETSDELSRREFLSRTYSTALVGLLFASGAATQAACDLPYADYSNYYYDYGYYYYNYYDYSYYNSGYYYDLYYNFAV